MSLDFIHIQENRLDRNKNLFLLFIPAMVFAIILSVMLSLEKPRSVATDNNSNVLGIEK